MSGSPNHPPHGKGVGPCSVTFPVVQIPAEQLTIRDTELREARSEDRIQAVVVEVDERRIAGDEVLRRGAQGVQDRLVGSRAGLATGCLECEQQGDIGLVPGERGRASNERLEFGLGDGVERHLGLLVGDLGLLLGDARLGPGLLGGDLRTLGLVVGPALLDERDRTCNERYDERSGDTGNQATQARDPGFLQPTRLLCSGVRGIDELEVDRSQPLGRRRRQLVGAFQPSTPVQITRLSPRIHPCVCRHRGGIGGEKQLPILGEPSD